MKIQPIARVHSPYKQKFAIPRQPRLVSSAIGRIVLIDEFSHPDFVRDIEQYSHIWLLFVFHQTVEQGYKPLVRPPRLGGNVKTGVFATRSTFRPNGIGMSAVKLEGVEITQGKAALLVSGLDLLDQTPVIDIKPYIPFSDAIDNADGGMASEIQLADYQVEFSAQAKLVLQQQLVDFPNLQTFIEQVLAQDPRPAYKKSKQDPKRYGVQLYHFNILWRVDGQCCLVEDIVTLHEPLLT